jgi:hypothetical protein
VTGDFERHERGDGPDPPPPSFAAYRYGLGWFPPGAFAARSGTGGEQRPDDPPVAEDLAVVCSVLTVPLGLWLAVAPAMVDRVTRDAALTVVGLAVAVFALLQACGPRTLAAAGWVSAALGAAVALGPVLLVGESLTGTSRLNATVTGGLLVLTGSVSAVSGRRAAAAAQARAHAACRGGPGR